MPHEGDAAELRALQAKAYGREGVLTDGDAARLRELEASRLSVDEAVPPEARAAHEPVFESADFSALAGRTTPFDSAAPVADAEAPVVDADADADANADANAEVDADAATGGATLHAIRKHWKAVTAASALLLVVGMGAGWALFGSSAGTSLTAEQQERRAELQADGDYDAGSLRMIGQDEDAVVWFATRDEGARSCITLDTAEDSAEQCLSKDELESNGYSVGVSARSVATEDDGVAEQVWATAVRTTAGEIVAFVQRWPVESDDDAWLSQFPGDERGRAEELLDAGFVQYGFSVVGYFQDAPVWFGTKTTGTTQEECLIVDSLQATQCSSPGMAQSSDADIGVKGSWIDDADGSVRDWSVTLAHTPGGSPYLVITGDVPLPPKKVKPGETVELGGEYQDPIQVEVPSDDAEG